MANLAPNWETRKFLRQWKGRPTYWVTVTRLDPHAKNSKRARTTDPRGYDPLEEMRLNRGDAHPSLPDSFHEHRVNTYVAARDRAMRPTIGQLRMIEAAIGCDVACRAAVQAWRGAA